VTPPTPAWRSLSWTSSQGQARGCEQPKFTTRVLQPDGVRRAVIVKFSPTGTDAAARRWRDLLSAEHAALSLLRELGVPAAHSRLLDAGGRLFLEVERFDRCGDLGRRGLLSLAALDDHYVGRRRSWTDTADHLVQAGLISQDEARLTRLLDTFGALIANTDRHLGNLSLFADNFAHSLAPAYDMLPMAYRPTDQGEVRAVEFRPPPPRRPPMLRCGRRHCRWRWPTGNGWRRQPKSRKGCVRSPLRTRRCWYSCNAWGRPSPDNGQMQPGTSAAGGAPPPTALAAALA
jgi:hypothetical protein